jgi:hypothetical protein
MCPVPVITRGESWLLAAASAVLVAGVVAVLADPFSDEPGTPGALPSASPTLVPSSSPSPTATAPVLVVSGVRISTNARGSHQLVVRARVSAGASATLLVGDRSYPLQLHSGEVTGTVPVTCGSAVPELQLVVTTAAGDDLSRSLGRPAAAFAEACAAPLPGGPVPTSSPRGS